jgi:hypothetical protein
MSTHPCGGSHVCLYGNRVSWCRDSCTACMGEKAQPCFAEHEVPWTQTAHQPVGGMQTIARWIKILVLLLALYWALGVIGNMNAWSRRGCDHVLTKAVFLGTPGALDICRTPVR